MNERTLLVDGLEPKPGVTLWGKATQTPEGLWRCYANVCGVLCVVELTVSQIEATKEPSGCVASMSNQDNHAPSTVTVSRAPETAVHQSEELKQIHTDAENHNNVDDQPDFRVDRHNTVEEIENHTDNHECNEESDHLRTECTERAEVTYALRPLDNTLRWARIGCASDRPEYAAISELRKKLVAHLSECIILPGWRCRSPGCSGWMGAEKEELTHCRACGAPRDP